MFRRTKKSSVAPIDNGAGVGVLTVTIPNNTNIEPNGIKEKTLDKIDSGLRGIAKVAAWAKPYQQHSPVTAPKLIREMKSLSKALNEEREETAKTMKIMEDEKMQIYETFTVKFHKGINIIKGLLKKLDRLKTECEDLQDELEYQDKEIAELQSKIEKKNNIRKYITPLSSKY